MKKPLSYESLIIPGRGLGTQRAIQARREYLEENGYAIESISRHFLPPSAVQHNIESFIGTTEIPLGIVGPLLFRDNNHDEYAYAAAGTLEGALIASMNRGARAISLSKGFTATIMYQRMVRAPLFLFRHTQEAAIFDMWVQKKQEAIQHVAEGYSNHAKLTALHTHVIGPDVHVKFVYTTGDAAGQNMTTTCTWHAMLWIVEHFLKETGIEIPHFVIEGNGSSDKKASRYLIEHGRGIGVTAECFLEEPVIQKVLRTHSRDICRFYSPSVQMAQQDGMLGYNINVANAIAAIFVATGQDLASIQESGTGLLEVQQKPGGLALRLTLPSLVIGTVGGGTSLPDQHEGLAIMGCAGAGKVERFAKLIAGFALALELSTYSAIVSGEFAKAHEKLGRNRPVKWLLKSELNETMIRSCLGNQIGGLAIRQVRVYDNLPVENGIITQITQRVNNKLTGFIPARVTLESGATIPVLIKSKALDLDVIKGLHLMAASIDPRLSDLLYANRHQLEYWTCHEKELRLYWLLSENGVKTIPAYYGNFHHPGREIYLLFQEYLNADQMDLFDAENTPERWTKTHIHHVISAISDIHLLLHDRKNQKVLAAIPLFEPWKSSPLYHKMADILCQENENSGYEALHTYIDTLESLHASLQLPLTVIHNDFNPRNVAIRKNGLPCIYDWELAVKNIPHRDIVEFLCFALPLDFEKQVFYDYLDYHF
ncbi:MAG: phosphotransferase, partial [Cyclobacteriaceae bacterium]|nr:phosphotransferase [Cyclobacteriaceae bacterium]